MTELIDIQMYTIAAIGDGWLSTAGWDLKQQPRGCCFILPDGSIRNFLGMPYIDEVNNRFAVTHQTVNWRNSELDESAAIFVSAPATAPPKWKSVSIHDSKWSVSDNDVFSAGLNDIRRNRDLKERPNTLYKALVPRQFVKNIFDLTACNRTIVVYAMMSGKFTAIKTPIKNPRAVMAKDGMTILVYGDKPNINKEERWHNLNHHFCIIDNPFV